MLPKGAASVPFCTILFALTVRLPAADSGATGADPLLENVTVPGAFSVKLLKVVT